jgi:hypothetical protein
MMSDLISVRCPACQARLTLKDPKLRGHKISCPKCSKPFVVPAGQSSPDNIFLDDAEPQEAGASSPSGRLPPRRTTGGPKTQNRRSNRRWLIPGLIGCGVFLIGGVVAIVVAVLSLSRAWLRNNFPDNAGAPPEMAQEFTPFQATEMAEPFDSAASSADPTVEEVLGEWTMADEWLVSPGDPVALLQLAEHPPEEYTVSINVRRLTGKDTFAIGLPVAGRQVLAAFDAQNGNVSGLEFVDGKNLNENGAAYRGRLLLPDREVTIDCTVRRNGITCTCGDTKVIDWNGDLRKLSPTDFVVPDKKAIFLVTLGSRIAVREINVSAPTDLSSAIPPVATSAQPPVTDEEKAAKELEARGWSITRDRQQPGQPVVMISSGLGPDTSNGIDSEDLKRILALRHLNTLSLGKTILDDRVLETVSKLELLEHFWVTGTIKTEAFRHLTRLKKLKNIELYTNDNADDALEILSSIQSLRRLRIAEARVTDRGLKSVAKMKGLDWLYISRGGISDAGLRELKALKNLKELHIYPTFIDSEVTDKGIAEVRKALPKCQVTVE